jgi:RND family efflux transporter MFP subunit
VQNAANGASGALPVVTLSQLDRLRVFVYVDQRDAASVKAGDRVEIVLPYQGEVVPGQVSRVAGELEPRTRTMTVEIDLDNAGGAIVPGSFLTVRLRLAGKPQLRVPAAALLIRQQKPLVAVVGADNRVKLRGVTVAQHDGAFVALASGLAEGERVALNVDRSIRDGDRVRPAPPPSSSAAPAPPSDHAVAGK